MPDLCQWLPIWQVSAHVNWTLLHVTPCTTSCVADENIDRYVHNIGPQDTFPVPEGIWNYHGSNYLAVSLWALNAEGAKVANLSLVAGPVIQSGYGPVALSPMTGWTERVGAY